MFERFTDKARSALVCAMETARELRHGFIGTEHLLAGMLLNEGRAAKALESLGLDYATVCAKIVEINGPGTGTPAGHIPFTIGLKNLFAAVSQANTAENAPVVTESDLLLHILDNGDHCGAAKILRDAGADMTALKVTVIQERDRDYSTDLTAVLSAIDRLGNILGHMIAAGDVEAPTDYVRGQADAARTILDMLGHGQ